MNRSEKDKDFLLWEKFNRHCGHHVEIAAWGDENNPMACNVSLVCEDCQEIILDSELFTIAARNSK